MTRNIHIEVTDNEFDRLSDTKDANGLTWKGLLLRGAIGLDSGGPLQSEE